MNHDDDRYALPAAGCHAARAAPHGRNALPPGARLAEFEIVSLIGEGGFGIVYLAHDHALQRRVALKEYLPISLAGRGEGVAVSVMSERYVETFQAGLKSFVNEARLLAQFDHPSLVKVYRFWEGNGTAYMVMPYYEGTTLRAALKRMPQPPDEAWLKRLLSDMLDALTILHDAHCLHRDIAPDNILLVGDDHPVLLDFGAARRVIGDHSQALTVILKPGYAPVEQYADAVSMKQGPWTDLYALAAVARFAITREPPTPSVARTMNDPLVPLARLAAGRYSDAFLRGLDHALAVKPDGRPQDAAAMRALLQLDEKPKPSRAMQPARRIGLLAGLGVLAVGAVAAIAYYALSPSDETSTRQVSHPLGSPVKASSPGPPAAPAPFDPIRLLDAVFEARNRDHAITVAIERVQLRIGADRLRFNVRSSRPGYLYVLMVGTDRSHLYLLFPNALDKANRIEAGKDLALPRANWQITAAGPPGTNHFVAIVSDHPREFNTAGLRTMEPFSEFPLTDVELSIRGYRGAQPLLAGKPVCPPSSECPEAYGAAVFSIEEVGGR